MSKRHLFQENDSFFKIGQKKYTNFFLIKQDYIPENSVWLCRRYHKNRRQSGDIKNLYNLPKKISRCVKNYRIKMATYCLVTGLHTLNLYFASNLQAEKSRKNNIQTDLRSETDEFYQYYVSRTELVLNVYVQHSATQRITMRPHPIPGG